MGKYSDQPMARNLKRKQGSSRKDKQSFQISGNDWKKHRLLREEIETDFTMVGIEDSSYNMSDKFREVMEIKQLLLFVPATEKPG